MRGRIDGASHLRVCRRGVRVQGDDITGDAGQPGQGAVHPQNGIQLQRALRTVRGVGHVLGGLQGDLIDLLLLTAALAVDPRAAQEDVERQTDDRQQEDEQEPGRG